ncbi:hypothetical protein [Rufibacter sp. LB8]|uniref:hypothetical protein n=1 Tax=Rufibacter sp. LB8 TaxID=2777781 RepID=UPI00178C5A04|nr:hypothetical protein [Rufibacter sp. LB8]
MINETIKNEYQITYSGKWLSINQAYNSNRFSRGKVKNDFKAIYKPLLLELGITSQIQKYCLEVRYWSKLDSLNVSAGLKIFEDSAVELGLIINDDKRFGKGITIIPDSTLKHNTYIVKIIELN